MKHIMEKLGANDRTQAITIAAQRGIIHTIVVPVFVHSAEKKKVTDFYFPTNVWAFGVAAFIIGLLCVVLRVERSAYRYASITLAIVMLVPRSTSGRLVAVHRFFEVSIGIAVGLAFFALWSRIGRGVSANASQASSIR